MINLPSLISLTIACIGLASCANHVDMPKGTSKGYTSARLIQRDPTLPASSNATENQVHRMIQSSLAKQFDAKGMAYGKGDAELVVAYMVIYQEPGMTADFRDYFGYGRKADDIAAAAHNRGALTSRPEYFQQAGILVDVVEKSTNKLIYRGLAKGDVVKGVSDSTREARIDAAVEQALSPFFK